MTIDPMPIVEAILGVGGVGGIGGGIAAAVRWVTRRIQRIEQENRDAHIECIKRNTELAAQMAVIEKRSYESAVADRTLLITTLERNTVAVDNNSNVLEKFASTIVDRTPPGGHPIERKS